MPRGQAHGKEWQLCRVLCHGTRQKMVAHDKINFQIFFCLITNISNSNQINITGNSYILHQMSQSFHISQFASYSIHRSPNANITMHTNPNVVDTSPSSTGSSYMSIQAQVQTIVYTKSACPYNHNSRLRRRRRRVLELLHVSHPMRRWPHILRHRRRGHFCWPISFDAAD